MQQIKPNGTTHRKLFGKSKLHDPSTGLPYMTRWFIGNLRLHQMHRGDLQRDCHDHPWWFITFPLTPYVEEVLEYRDGRYFKELNIVKAWRFHFRKARYTHRILGPYYPKEALRDRYRWTGDGYLVMPHPAGDLGAPPAKTMWTLVLRGRVRQKWGFWKVVEGARDGLWVKAKQYFNDLGVPYTEGATSEMPDNLDRKPS